VTRIFAILVALALTAQQAPAQSKPNFSGSWKMSAARSDFGAIPAAVSMERKITHAEPSLVIVEAQDVGSGVQTATRTYTTDSEVEVVMLKYIDRMTLSPDGKTLTSVVKLATPQGEVDMKVVFEKQ
jgi:hypothetical protein